MSAPRARQRGLALLLVMAVLALSSTWYMVRRLQEMNANTTASDRARNAAVLNRAKQALIGYVAAQAAKAGEDNPGALPCPEALGYFDSTTQDGQTASSCTLPKVGRFPWRTIGTDKLVDAAGEPLWYVVGANWAKPNSTTNTIINSNSTGQLTVDNVANDAVALIIAPGPAISVAAATGCTAWTQVRPTTGNPDWRNYLECYDATNPAVFVTTGPSGSFNDQVIKITAADLLPAIEAGIARRFEREIAPKIRSAYSNSDAANPNLSWPATNPVLPFAATFADPTTSAFKGSAATFQGLLPLTYSETIPGSHVPCAAGPDARCDPTFIAWSSPPSPTLSQPIAPLPPYIRPNPAVCTVNNLSQPTQVECVVFIVSAKNTPAPSAPLNVVLQGGVRNVGMALRQFDTTVAMQNIDVNGRSVSGVLNVDGSAAVTLNATIPAGVTNVKVPNGNCVGGVPGGNDCFSATITVPITLLADHTVLDANDATYGWFVRNKWHAVLYYAVAPNVAPSGTRSCVAPPGTPSCLSVNYLPSVSWDSNPLHASGKQRGLVVIAGRSLLGSARPNGTLSDWLEGSNIDVNRFLASPYTPFTARSSTLSWNRTFNDRIAVIDSN